MQTDLAQLRAAPVPERVEVPVVPESVSESLAELAARAEAPAAETEENAAGKLSARQSYSQGLYHPECGAALSGQVQDYAKH